MSGSETDGVGRREVAWRLFAAEFDDATLEYSDSDEERAPNYVVTPTGARVNRVLVIGVLTEVESVSDDVLRARVVDPTGAFVVYAGQYQPDAATFLERAEPPMYVAVTGKARTFTPDGSDRVFTSIRPESITEVDAETRDRWTVQAASHTIDRIAAMAAALDREDRGEALAAVLRDAGVDPGLAAGIPVAIEHYGTTPAYLSALRRTAVDALEVVTGDRDEVTPLDAAPDEAGTADAPVARPIGGLVDRDVSDRIAAAEVPADAATEPTDAAPEEPAIASTDDAAPTGDAPEPSTGAATDADQSVDDATAGDDAEAAGPDAAASGDGELYEVDEDEREHIEAEYGTEFSAGSEVDAPGEAGIEPEASGGDLPAESSSPPADEAHDEQSEPTESAADGEDAATASAGDVDLEAAAVAAMRDLDDGDGAGHDAVVDAVASEYGVDEDTVADAIQDALMSGKCYEPGDDRLKAI